jgi:hypothetical protein
MADDAENRALERVMDGSTWSEFCDTLKMAGNLITGRIAPDDPLDRAEGFRYLSRVTRAALEGFVEFADPKAPVLHRPVHETVKLGSDNPDLIYQNATISGEHDYRLFGKRGSVHYLGLGTYAGNYGMSSGRRGETGYLEARDLKLGRDGELDVLLSCRPQEGNWLKMEPDTSSLIVRQMFLDRENETAADLTIERIGGDGLPTPLTPLSFDRGLTAAARLVVGATGLFASWVEGFKKHPNQLPLFDQKTSLAAHGDPNITYYHSYWQLAEDEALVVEADVPECDYWNFQLNNYWVESLDYRFYRIAINKASAVYRDDGSVRIVVAHRDPGVENWLTTAGHRQGTMCFRWVRADRTPQPQTRVVKLAEL